MSVVNSTIRPNSQQPLDTQFKALQAQIVQQDLRNFTEETNRLEGFVQEVGDVVAIIKKFNKIADDNVTNLKKEFAGLTEEQRKHQGALKEFQDKHLQDKTQIAKLRSDYKLTKKKRVAIAETLNLKPLVDLQIEDRKSQSHQVFKWVLSVLYKEPSNKYYWGNFVEQALKSDKGKDFRERLGKMSAGELKEDQRVATQKLLDKKSVLIQHNDFNSQEVKEQVKKIIEIAELILRGSNIAKEEMELDAIDGKSRDAELLKQAAIEKITTKMAAVQESIDMSVKYQDIMLGLEKKTQYQGSDLYGGSGRGGQDCEGIEADETIDCTSAYPFS